MWARRLRWQPSWRSGSVALGLQLRRASRTLRRLCGTWGLSLLPTRRLLVRKRRRCLRRRSCRCRRCRIVCVMLLPLRRLIVGRGSAESSRRRRRRCRTSCSICVVGLTWRTLMLRRMPILLRLRRWVRSTWRSWLACRRRRSRSSGSAPTCSIRASWSGSRPARSTTLRWRLSVRRSAVRWRRRNVPVSLKRRGRRNESS